MMTMKTNEGESLLWIGIAEKAMKRSAADRKAVFSWMQLHDLWKYHCLLTDPLHHL